MQKALGPFLRTGVQFFFRKTLFLSITSSSFSFTTTYGPFSLVSSMCMMCLYIRLQTKPILLGALSVGTSMRWLCSKDRLLRLLASRLAGSHEDAKGLRRDLAFSSTSLFHGSHCMGSVPLLFVDVMKLSRLSSKTARGSTPCSLTLNLGP